LIAFKSHFLIISSRNTQQTRASLPEADRKKRKNAKFL